MDMGNMTGMGNTTSTSGMGSNSSTMSMTMPMMVPYLHFASGDNLLFKTLVPSTGGAVAGASIVLLLFAILERLVAASRRAQEVYWMRSSKRVSSDVDEKSTGSHDDQPKVIMPFSLKHDFVRGLYHAAQAFMLYTLMLCVMTFQAAYIICIIAGLGIGEMVFGRIGRGAAGTSVGVYC